MEIIKDLFLIALMVMGSKVLRQTAFGRPDSIALDVSICCFLYNLLVVAGNWAGLEWFVRQELLRCLLLFLFAFVIAFVHKQNKKKCIKQVRRIVREMKAPSDAAVGHPAGMSTERDSLLEETVLENLELLADGAIDVWYSQFADALFHRQLKTLYDKKHADEDAGTRSKGRSFKAKKKKVRSAFAEIVNSLPAMNGKLMRSKYADTDFNIGNEDQIMGMIIFDVMMVLSLILTVRLI